MPDPSLGPERRNPPTPIVLLPRLLTTVIVGFWLIMSGLLLRSIWFPADSRLAEVNPGAVFQLIAARGEPSALDIYDDRRIVGSLSVMATPVGNGTPARTHLKLNAQINFNSALLPGTNLDLYCHMDLDREGNPRSWFLKLATIKPKLKLVLAQASPEAAPSVLLENDGKVLLDSSLAEPGKPEANPLLALLLGSLGMSYLDFQAIRADAGVKAAGVKIEARQGIFELGDGTRQGFILKIGTPGQPGFRMCVDNTGEIVRLETPVSYHLMTESVRPESARLR